MGLVAGACSAVAGAGSGGVRRLRASEDPNAAAMKPTPTSPVTTVETQGGCCAERRGGDPAQGGAEQIGELPDGLADSVGRFEVGVGDQVGQHDLLADAGDEAAEPVLGEGPVTEDLEGCAPGLHARCASVQGR
jgi:hypothetical protein